MWWVARSGVPEGVGTVENGLEQGEGQHCRDRCRRELMLSPEKWMLSNCDVVVQMKSPESGTGRCALRLRRQGFGLGVAMGLVWGLRGGEAAVRTPRPQACAPGWCCGTLM